MEQQTYVQRNLSAGFVQEKLRLNNKQWADLRRQALNYRKTQQISWKEAQMVQKEQYCRAFREQSSFRAVLEACEKTESDNTWCSWYLLSTVNMKLEKTTVGEGSKSLIDSISKPQSESDVTEEASNRGRADLSKILNE